jgi:hypothetical protein
MITIFMSSSIQVFFGRTLVLISHAVPSSVFPNMSVLITLCHQLNVPLYKWIHIYYVRRFTYNTGLTSFLILSATFQFVMTKPSAPIMLVSDCFSFNVITFVSSAMVIYRQNARDGSLEGVSHGWVKVLYVQLLEKTKENHDNWHWKVTCLLPTKPSALLRSRFSNWLSVTPIPLLNFSWGYFPALLYNVRYI